MKIFLSHTNSDKQFVRRLSKDLQSHGFDIWFDEEQIAHGESIPAAINRAISECQILILFISKNSVASKWVTAEWESALSKSLSGAEIRVIPLRLDDAEVPVFLTPYLYADFREKDQYEKNLSLLLRSLSIQRSDFLGHFADTNRTAMSVLEVTQELLDDLDSEFISMPMHKRLAIIDTLKKIPRSGKKVRLEHFRPAVRIRSIYDHVLSVAHSADCLLSCFEHDLRERDHAALAQCIAYHELNEIVLGDIPTYTSLSATSRNRARIVAEERLRSVQPDKRERIANKFIWMFLGEKQRRAMEFVTATLADEVSPISVTFKLLDKIDPIIATWRYLHHYRGRIGENPKEFNKKMKDFYENPDIRAFITARRMDRAVLDLVANLQDRRKAWDYYENPERVFTQKRFFEIPEQSVRNLIEEFPLFHDEERSEQASNGRAATATKG